MSERHEFWKHSPFYRAHRERMALSSEGSMNLMLPANAAIFQDQADYGLDSIEDLRHDIERMASVEYQYEGKWRY